MVRVVGPIGIERLIVMNPETIHKLMVTDWVDYPRVSVFQKINRTRSRSGYHSRSLCVMSWASPQAMDYSL